MHNLHHYTIRAESRATLIAVLESAQAGKARPFVVEDENGGVEVDASRIRYPYAEMTVAITDPETGELVAPPVATGDWLCEVWLVEADGELAAAAGV
ncbi:hypothetical protein [Parvibaculum sp.]|jgi:hypothetical protein|uniref:hypothetical protein n=1 Tax=Parvibaculum sp. TaxID=2024848 RepID=UPI0025DDF906|nr:hypothetical protein [Parvibaculum sp.]